MSKQLSIPIEMTNPNSLAKAEMDYTIAKERNINNVYLCYCRTKQEYYVSTLWSENYILNSNTLIIK